MSDPNNSPGPGGGGPAGPEQEYTDNAPGRWTMCAPPGRRPAGELLAAVPAVVALIVGGALGTTLGGGGGAKNTAAVTSPGRTGHRHRDRFGASDRTLVFHVRHQPRHADRNRNRNRPRIADLGVTEHESHADRRRTPRGPDAGQRRVAVAQRQPPAQRNAPAVLDHPGHPAAELERRCRLQPRPRLHHEVHRPHHRARRQLAEVHAATPRSRSTGTASRSPPSPRRSATRRRSTWTSPGCCGSTSSTSSLEADGSYITGGQLILGNGQLTTVPGYHPPVPELVREARVRDPWSRTNGSAPTAERSQHTSHPR